MRQLRMSSAGRLSACHGASTHIFPISECDSTKHQSSAGEETGRELGEGKMEGRLCVSHPGTVMAQDSKISNDMTCWRRPTRPLVRQPVHHAKRFAGITGPVVIRNAGHS